MPRTIRVRLRTSRSLELPVGSRGTVLLGNPAEPGMSLVRWDWLMAKIPMYNNELEIVE